MNLPLQSQPLDIEYHFVFSSVDLTEILAWINQYDPQRINTSYVYGYFIPEDTLHPKFRGLRVYVDHDGLSMQFKLTFYEKIKVGYRRGNDMKENFGTRF